MYPERPILRKTRNPLNYQIPGFITPRINHWNSALIYSVVILPLEIPRPRVPMLIESLWITLKWLTIEMIACSNTTRLHGLARIRIYCRIGMNWDSRSWLSSTEIFSARTKAITGFSARPKAVSRPQVGCDITAFLDRTKAVSRPRKESFLQVPMGSQHFNVGARGGWWGLKFLLF